MKSNLFAQQYLSNTQSGPFALQNERMLKVSLDGEFHARQGSMVAYAGDVRFEFQGAGMKRLLKKMVTGEDLQLMKVSGRGDVYLAKYAEEVHIIELENESITVSGEHILALEPTLAWDVQRVKGISGMATAGIFNIVVSGTGKLALTADGTPVVLDAGAAPTFADMDAAIAWSTSLSTTFKKGDSMVKSMVGRGSGELFQVGFAGKGYVIVQPSEGSPYGVAAATDSGGGAVNSGLGSLFQG